MSSLPDTYVLLRASRRPRTRAQLTSALEPELKEVLGRVCLWDDDWDVGDYRFCVFSYGLPGDAGIFMQFWSEPGEPVLWEVSSGKWHAPTEAYLAGDRAQRIQAAGFQMAGEAENYQKDVDVQTPRDVTALARHVIALLYDALDYRGQQALDVQAVADSRATWRAVYESLLPDDLALLLERAGYACEVGEETDDDVDEAAGLQPRNTVPVYVRRYGIRAMAMLAGRLPEDGGFEIIALGPAPPASQKATEALLMEGLDVLVLPLAGGVTAEWLEHQVAGWFEERRQEKRKAKKGPPAVRPKTSRSIH